MFNKDALTEWTRQNAPRKTHKMHSCSDENCDALYAWMKEFWINRDKHMTAEQVGAVVRQYREDVKFKRRTVPAAKIAELAAELAGGDRVCKVLEIGGANGVLAHTLREMGRDTGIHITNFEPWKPYVDDFKAHLPGHLVVQADAEEFLDAIETNAFAKEQFDIFYESGALCMISPQIARAALAKGAELCRHIVICDYIANGSSEIDTDENLIFEQDAKNSQFYFAHNYKAYLADIGFHCAEVRFLPWANYKWGWGMIHAAPAPA